MSSESDNYYKILEVSEKSSQDEIKKAFRRLSLKYHPDKNPNSVFFTKINEAYQTLSDEQKRREYDQINRLDGFARNCGIPGSGLGPGFHFFNVNEEDDLGNIIDKIFSNFQDMGIHRFSNEFKNACNSEEELTRAMGGPGRMGSIRINRGGLGGVGGSGGLGGLGLAGGGGVFMKSFGGEMHKLNSDNLLFEKPVPIVKTINITMTQVFNGSQIPIVVERWINENGAKVFENETIYIKIPCGIDNNEMLLLKDKGNVLRHNCRGDVKIFFNVDNDSDFKRQGLDLILEKKISLQESLCGFKFELKYFNNKFYTIYNNIGNIIYPGFKKVIPNMGLKRENDQGNLIIHFDVLFPSRISTDSLTKLNDIFNEEFQDVHKEKEITEKT